MPPEKAARFTRCYSYVAPGADDAAGGIQLSDNQAALSEVEARAALQTLGLPSTVICRDALYQSEWGEAYM